MNALDFLEALPIMLWTARADGVWTHVNPRWESYTGYQGDAPGHFGFEAALHPEDVAPTVARWTEAVVTGTPYRAEYRLRRLDGLYRWHLTQGAKAPRPDADFVWTGACTDIHDQKLAEQEAHSAREAAVRALGLMLEVKDHETKGHTDRVTDLALRLGAAVGLPPHALEALRLGAYLHDVGKITVPDSILLKPGLLTPEEWQIMQEHVVNGDQFSTALGFLSEEALQVIRGHHERWDGTGYPAGIQAAEIPLPARIFALADVYDALISERPYKRAWTSGEALSELKAQAGRHFDPELTDLFLKVVREEAIPDITPESIAVFARLSESVRASALEEASISVLITDAQQRLVYVNPAFCRVTGYAPEEVIGRNPRFLQGPATNPKDREALRNALKEGRPVHQLILNYNRAGEKLWFEMHITPVFVQGELAYFVAIQNDSSTQVETQQQLEWVATHDALTGLLNRASLNQAVEELNGAHALVFLDVNDLKGINDRHGHAAGDEALKHLAKTLTIQVAGEGQNFRLGGDEFLALLPVRRTQGGDQILTQLQQLRRALANMTTEQGPLSVSIGVAYFPDEGQDPWRVISLADERMYQDKLGHANRRGSSTRN